MAKIDSFHALFVEELQDLYETENQLIELFPALANASSAPGLTLAFTDHLADSKKHADRIEQIMDGLRVRPVGAIRKTLPELVADARRRAQAAADVWVKDMALVVCSLRIEHYEIAGYRNARTLARRLGLEDAAELLRNTLDEELTADENFTGLSRRLKAEAARGNFARKLI
jgi:ferritin-like metal-binding protein YciE